MLDLDVDLTCDDEKQVVTGVALPDQHLSGVEPHVAQDGDQVFDGVVRKRRTKVSLAEQRDVFGVESTFASSRAS